MAALAHFTVLCSTAELPPDNLTSTQPTSVRVCGFVDVRRSATRRAAAAASIPVSLVGQDRRLSPARPGFNSRTGKVASRAPLAERSAVNRQVLGSIPSGGDYLFGFIFGRAPNKQEPRPNAGHHEPMAQRQRVGFQTRRLGVQIPLGSLICLQSSVGRAVGC